MGARRERVPVGDRAPGRSYRPDLRPPSIFGAHQPGIATAKLPHDALSAFTVHTGSAVFAVPPGARPGGFLGEEWLEAARPAPSGSA